LITRSLNEVLKKKQCGKRLIFGIDGLSGAGKTTFVKEFERELAKHNIKSAVLHLDDLIVERSKRYRTGFEEWYEHYFLQWDIPSITNKVFASWERGETMLELDVYDSKTDSLTSRTMRVPCDGILLVEGVFLQRKEWRGFFDLVLYIDCPRSTRFERVTRRGNHDIQDQERIELYKRRYWAAEDYYLETEKPLQHADLVWKTTESS
jgi:uridine kinase